MQNKGAAQLHSNREADQRLCFCYIDSTIPLLSIRTFKPLHPAGDVLWIFVEPGNVIP